MKTKANKILIIVKYLKWSCGSNKDGNGKKKEKKQGNVNGLIKKGLAEERLTKRRCRRTRTFFVKENHTFYIREERKTGQGVRKIEVAEAKNQPFGEQCPAETGVA